MSLRVGPIVKKELKTYFNSPIAYIVTIVFLLVTSVWFFVFQSFFQANYASLRGFFSAFPYVFIVVIPAITMRLWAEEKKMKSDEILVTLPFTETELVLGKYLGAFILFLIMLGCTLFVPFFTSFAGSFEIGEIAGQYIGSILFGAVCIAVGMFISSLCNNQISAFLVSILALALLIMIGFLPLIVKLPSFISIFINNFFALPHFESFKKGIFDFNDFIYFISVTFIFIYFNIKVLVLKKWN